MGDGRRSFLEIGVYVDKYLEVLLIPSACWVHLKLDFTHSSIIMIAVCIHSLWSITATVKKSSPGRPLVSTKRLVWPLTQTCHICHHIRSNLMAIFKGLDMAVKKSPKSLESPNWPLIGGRY